MKLRWSKSSFCGGDSCVEVAKGRSGDTATVLIRQSDARGRVLKFTQDEWDAFVAGVKGSEFD